MGCNRIVITYYLSAVYILSYIDVFVEICMHALISINHRGGWSDHLIIRSFQFFFGRGSTSNVMMGSCNAQKNAVVQTLCDVKSCFQEVCRFIF